MGSEMCIRDSRRGLAGATLEVDDGNDLQAVTFAPTGQIGLAVAAVSYTHLTLPTSDLV